MFYLLDNTYLPVFEEPGLGCQYLELHDLHTARTVFPIGGICQNINDIKLKATVKFI